MAISGEQAILLVALHNVLDDVSFATDSPEALELAKKLKGWREKYSNPEEGLVSNLSGTFTGPSTSGSILNREKMWRSLFQLCSSARFLLGWTSFLNACATSDFQHLTDII